jgi:hypothetical protein
MLATVLPTNYTVTFLIHGSVTPAHPGDFRDEFPSKGRPSFGLGLACRFVNGFGGRA